MKMLPFACALAAAVLPSVSYAESWVCIIDQSTGFSFNATTKSWVKTSFKPNDRYLISPDTSIAGYNYKVAQFGGDAATAKSWCKEAFEGVPFAHCDGLAGAFHFNRTNGRLLHTYTLGYFNIAPGTNKITDEKSDTPYIEIGTCSQL